MREESRGKRRPGAGRKRAPHPQTVLRIAATPAEKTRIEEALSTRLRTEVLMREVRRIEQAEQAIVTTENPLEGRVLRWCGPIPPGWKICDGANGTPDFRSQFILTDDGEPVVVGIIKVKVS